MFWFENWLEILLFLSVGNFKPKLKLNIFHIIAPQWNNNAEVNDKAPVNVGVVDVEEDEGEESVSKVDNVESREAAAPSPVEKKGNANDQQHRLLASKTAEQESGKEISDQNEEETQNRIRFTAIKSLDFGRLLSCR